MFTNQELNQYFSEDINEPQMKSKWYVILNYISFKNKDEINNILKEEVLKDSFWSNEEKNDISKLLKGEEVLGWIIEERAFGAGEHLDVCIIYCPTLIQEKLKKKLLNVNKSIEQLRKSA